MDVCNQRIHQHEEIDAVYNLEEGEQVSHFRHVIIYLLKQVTEMKNFIPKHICIKSSPCKISTIDQTSHYALG